MLVGFVERDDDGSFFEFGIGHLRGYGAFPNQIIEPLLGLRAGDVLGGEIGGADGFVGLLRAFGTGLVAAQLEIFGTHRLGYFGRGHFERGLGKVDRVGTHVCYLSVFV